MQGLGSSTSVTSVPGQPAADNVGGIAPNFRAILGLKGPLS